MEEESISRGNIAPVANSMIIIRRNLGAQMSLVQNASEPKMMLIKKYIKIEKIIERRKIKRERRFD